jgi:hypothetical protein
MGHFYQPPGPFTGGRQPYDNHDVPPSVEAVPVNNPAFSHLGRVAVTAALIASWQPPDPSPFIGGRQPLEPRHLPPSITAVPVNPPPFETFGRSDIEIAIIAAWVPPDPSPFIGGRQPLEPRKLAPSISAVPVDNPIPNEDSAVSFQVVLSQWETYPSDPQFYVFLGSQGRLQPYAPSRLPPSLMTLPVEVDNPPFGLLDTIIEPWLGDAPLPTLPRSGVILSVSPAISEPWQPIVLASWQPADPPAQSNRLLPPSITAVPVNNPVPNEDAAVNAQIAIAAWQPPDPPPVQRGPLAPSITAVPVNNPPFTHPGRSVVASAIPWTWQPPDPAPQLNQKIVLGAATSADNPPFGLLETIVDPWLGDPPLPTLAGKLPPSVSAVPVNNPPPSHPGRSVAEIAIIMAAWQPADQPWLKTVLLPQGFVAAAFQPFANNAATLTSVLAWQPADPTPTLPIRSAGIPGWSVDDPPGIPGADFIAIDLPPAIPQQPAKLPPSMAAVQVNNPPFSHPGRSPIAAIEVASWQPPDPLPTLNAKLLFGVQVDNPPFGLLETIVDPWIDVQPPIIAPKVFPQGASVSNPAFTHPGRLALLPSIIAAWQPPDPLPVQRGPLAPSITAVAVNNPPFSHCGRLPWMPPVVAAWQPPDPPPVQKGPLGPSLLAVQVSNPPFTHPARTLWFPPLVLSWQPPDPPPVQRGPLSPALTAVQIDNPPISLPPKWLQIVVGAWQPPDPLPTLPRITPPPTAPYAPYTRPWLPSVVGSWQPPDPPATLPRNLSPGIPGQSADPPPKKRPARPETFALWQDPDPPPVQRGPLNPSITAVRVDNPPFMGGAKLPLAVSISWLPPPPQPPVASTALPAYTLQHPLGIDPRFITLPQPRITITYGPLRIYITS